MLKKNYIPTIDGVEIAGVDLDASLDFITDQIEFIESTAWAVQFTKVSITGNPTFSITCSNNQYGDFYPYSDTTVDLDLSVDANKIVYDGIFAPRFMRIEYTANDAVGTFQLLISK